MDLRPEDIKTKAQIGVSGHSPVYEIVCKGGFHLVLVKDDDRLVTLGTGPHRAVARYIAKQRRPNLRITELSKSEDVEVRYFQHLLGKYQEMTDLCNRLLGRR